MLLLHGSTVGFQEEIRQSEATHHKETLLAVPASNLSIFTTKHENYRPQFHALDHFPVGDGMIFPTICRLAELTLCNKLSTSLQLSKEHIVRLQNTSIIFPFHTFP
jgi:hypothetical protein